MLKVDNLTIRRQENPLINQLSLELPRATSLAVISDNTLASSALLFCLAGLTEPDEGSIFGGAADPQLLSTALVLANPDNQFVTLSVADELAFGLENRAVAPAEIQHRVANFLDRFNLTALADQPPELLSGGEKQLTALASLLITEPELLLLDHPATMLDRAAEKLLFDQIFNSGVNRIILATDNPEDAIRCDYLLVLIKGEKCYFGPVKEIYHRYAPQLAASGFDLPAEILFKLT